MKKLIILAGFALGLVVVAVLSVYVHDSPAAGLERLEGSRGASDSDAIPASVAAPERWTTVYPNSVVPGGVHSIDEVVNATDDPVVKAHYAKIDLSNLKKVVLTADVHAFVSYRIGGKIYWTKTKQTIRTGEVVFTDGLHFIRGRCGNCYQDVPDPQVSQDEPSEEILSTPVLPPAAVPGMLATKTGPTLYIEQTKKTAAAGPIAAPSPSKKKIFEFLAIPSVVAGFWPYHHNPAQPPVTPVTPADPGHPTPPFADPISTDAPAGGTSVDPGNPTAPPVGPPSPEHPSALPPQPGERPVRPPPPPPPVNPPLPSPWNVPDDPPHRPWNPPDNPAPNPQNPPVISYDPPIDVTAHDASIPPVTVTPEPGFFFLVAGGMGALFLAKKYKKK